MLPSCQNIAFLSRVRQVACEGPHIEPAPMTWWMLLLAVKGSQSFSPTSNTLTSQSFLAVSRSRDSAEGVFSLQSLHTYTHKHTLTIGSGPKHRYAISTGKITVQSSQDVQGNLTRRYRDTRHVSVSWKRRYRDTRHASVSYKRRYRDTRHVSLSYKRRYRDTRHASVSGIRRYRDTRHVSVTGNQSVRQQASPRELLDTFWWNLEHKLRAVALKFVNISLKHVANERNF
jgi:hypothetical protein